jgi:hypothetical protein
VRSSPWPESRYTGLFTQLGPVPSGAHHPALSIWGGPLASWGARSEALGVARAGWDRAAARAACPGGALGRDTARRLVLPPTDAVLYFGACGIVVSRQ